MSAEKKNQNKNAKLDTKFVIQGPVEIHDLHMNDKSWESTMWMNHYFSMIGAYCYAELGILIKSSGGDYSYILYTFGPFVGFVRLWAECAVVR